MKTAALLRECAHGQSCFHFYQRSEEMHWPKLPARNSESVCLQPSPVLLPILLTWATLHLCWAGFSHLWWRNGLVCLSFGHNKIWGSSPRQGRCFWITWWNTPPCYAKYPVSTGSVTCAFPPALLLHSAYLEPSFSSWNFNHISFLNRGLSHITAQQKSLESTEDEFYSSASIYTWR